MAHRLTNTTPDIERMRGELQRLMEDYKTADTKEKAALQDRIDKLEDHIEAEKKAKEEKEKAEGTGGTLVLPPEQTPQGQEHGDRPGDKPASEQHEERHGYKKPWWKRVY
jgi:hypothetical protein